MYTCTCIHVYRYTAPKITIFVGWGFTSAVTKGVSEILRSAQNDSQNELSTEGVSHEREKRI